MNRGRDPVLAHAGNAEARFNEAPIHESGKVVCGALIDPINQRFNEAPIHESGKAGVGRLGLELVHVASMRPRFMNRGRAVAVHIQHCQT